MWDTYQSDSLKESTQEKRGKGVRRKASGRAKLPSNWIDFLRDPNNKSELFALLTSKLQALTFLQTRLSMLHQSVISTMSTGMMNCNHEEADTRIIVIHALCQGMKSVKVRTVDTDLVIILTGAFFEFSQAQPLVDIWVAFGMGKNYRFYSINTIYSSIGELKSHALPVSTPSLAVTLHPPSRERVRSQSGRHGKHMKKQQRHYNTLLVNLFSTWIQTLIISRRLKD